MKRLIVVTVLLLLSFYQAAFAKVGVGVGTGKIVVDEELKPGIIYELPSLVVFNTGDVESEYVVNVAYHVNQPELMPHDSWFIFSPSEFHLEPRKSQEVKITLNLPLRTEPGDYFAYLESSPVIKGSEGETTVGIAAAAKLYFTVIPGSFAQGIYYKLLSLWNVYAPWPQRIAIGILIVVGLIFIKKFFHIEINLKKKTAPHGKRQKKSKPKDHDEAVHDIWQ